MEQGDRIRIRATVRKLCDDGKVACDVPGHPARIRMRPPRKVKVGDQVILSGEVISVLDRGRVVLRVEGVGPVTVLQDFAEAA